MQKNKTNYAVLLEQVLNKEDMMRKELSEHLPKHLLLHSCCAPCSSYVLEYLSEYFRITVFYYNPNITSEEEYVLRYEEQKRLVNCMNQTARFPIEVIGGEYEPERFQTIAKGLEHCPEGGERCFACYALRLERAAKEALSLQADYFTTTLSISPLKNAEKINEIGNNIARVKGIPFLPSDFKKKGGYQGSIELSKQYGLYRQNYCGCEYSLNECPNPPAMLG